MDKRKEFMPIRARLLKETARKEFICARCGCFSSSVNLHHIREICEGGDNDTSNLIPLCDTCHREWDAYKAVRMTLEEFLVTPPVLMWAMLAKIGVFKNEQIGETILFSYHARFASQAGAYSDAHGVDITEYYEELKRQNKVFSALPYSDHSLMVELYGGIFSSDKNAMSFLRENAKKIAQTEFRATKKDSPPRRR